MVTGLLGSHGQIGGCHPEAIYGVAHVAHRLNNSVGINVGVSASGNAIGGFSFVFGGETTGVSVRVLSKLILSVILAAKNSKYKPQVR